MKPSEHSLSTAEFFRRIDEMPMSSRDRERAKAQLQTALRFADGLWWILTALRSLRVSIAHRIAHLPTRRSTLRNSPAPR